MQGIKKRRGKSGISPGALNVAAALTCFGHFESYSRYFIGWKVVGHICSCSMYILPLKQHPIRCVGKGEMEE